MPQNQPIPLAILAAGFGALVGSIGSFLVKSYIERKRKANRKKITRKALIHELDSMPQIDTLAHVHQEYPGFHHYDITPQDTISKRVFDSNLDNLGLLSEKEREKIIRFYTYWDGVADFYEFFLSARRSFEEAGKRYDEEITMIDAATIGMFSELQERRDQAISELKKNV